MGDGGADPGPAIAEVLRLQLDERRSGARPGRRRAAACRSTPAARAAAAAPLRQLAEVESSRLEQRADARGVVAVERPDVVGDDRGDRGPVRAGEVAVGLGPRRAPPGSPRWRRVPRRLPPGSAGRPRQAAACLRPRGDHLAAGGGRGARRCGVPPPPAAAAGQGQRGRRDERSRRDPHRDRRLSGTRVPSALRIHRLHHRCRPLLPSPPGPESVAIRAAIPVRPGERRVADGAPEARPRPHARARPARREASPRSPSSSATRPCCASTACGCWRSPSRATSTARCRRPTSSPRSTTGSCATTPRNPSWPERDRFVLSKGHAAPIQYAALAEHGYFPAEDLMGLRQIGSHLQGHPDMTRTPGIEVSTGSLGQGLSMSVGICLGAAARRPRRDRPGLHADVRRRLPGGRELGGRDGGRPLRASPT